MNISGQHYPMRASHKEGFVTFLAFSHTQVSSGMDDHEDSALNGPEATDGILVVLHETMFCVLRCG